MNEVKKYYADLKKMKKADLIAAWKIDFRVGTPEQAPKMDLISDLLFSKFGRKRVKAAFN